MSRSFRFRMGLWSAGLGALLAGAGTRAQSAGGIAPRPRSTLYLVSGSTETPPPTRRVHYRRLDRTLSKLKRVLKSRSSQAEALEAIGKTRAALNDLRKTSPSRGDPNLFQQYCEISLGILADVEVQTRRSYWNAAQNSLLRLRSFQGEMERDFRPSWGRDVWSWMSSWF